MPDLINYNLVKTFSFCQHSQFIQGTSNSNKRSSNYNFVHFLFNCSNRNATVVTQLFISKLLSKIVTKHTMKELTYSERYIEIEMSITRST